MQEITIADELSDVRSDLSEIGDIKNSYLEFDPHYKIEAGYYTKSGDTVVLHSPTGGVGSCKTTNIIPCKEGYKFRYTGQQAGTSIFGYALFNGNICTSVGAVVGDHILTIPENVDGVMFQSYASPNNTPQLSVELIDTILLVDILGRKSGVEGQIWTKKEDGANWEDNPALLIANRNKSDIRLNREAIENDDSSFSYTDFTNGAYKLELGTLKWQSYSGVAGRITNKIPCYEGMRFLFCCSLHSYPNTIPSVAFYTDDTVVDVIYQVLNLSIITIPANVNYIVFQGVSSSGQSIAPGWFLDQHASFRYKHNTSRLDGVKWCVIGDSISMPPTNDYISYCNFFNNDGMICTNLAISGTGFSVGIGSETKYYDRIARIPEDTQLIVVTGSFNDLNRGPSLGTINDDTEATIAGCMNLFFTELIAEFPTVPMAIVITCPWSNYKPGVQSSDDYVAMLKSMSDKYGIPFYSLYDKTNLRPWNSACNELFYYKDDGVHPGTLGHRQIYALLKPFFEQVCYFSTPEYAVGRPVKNTYL